MRGQPGTTCTLTATSWWDGEAPVEGDFLRTPTGTCYRIDEIRGRRLICTRLERDAVHAGQPGVWGWRWNARRRT